MKEFTQGEAEAWNERYAICIAQPDISHQQAAATADRSAGVHKQGQQSLQFKDEQHDTRFRNHFD